ncbi:MAG TPA: hypothetical protein VMN57_00110 [Anaerolineales bacterium]|nr:hypothetical protein [Anaerolineales bacterium]
MKKPGIAAMLILISALLFIPIIPAWAYPAPPLPDDNLIINPWFRSAENPNQAGLDGWTNELTDGDRFGPAHPDAGADRNPAGTHRHTKPGSPGRSHEHAGRPDPADPAIGPIRNYSARR